MLHFKSAFGFAVAAAGAGCAWVQAVPMQDVGVSVISPTGAPVEGAVCRLANDRGNWTMVAPGSVAVATSPVDLSISCNRDGEPPGYMRGIARPAPIVSERLLAPGGTASLIDPVRHRAQAYPARVTVVLGASGVVDHPPLSR